MKKILFLFLLCVSCLNAALSPALLAAAHRRNSAVVGPSFGAAVGNVGVFNAAGTDVMTLSGSVSTGQRIVVAYACDSAVYGLSTVTDTKSNTYTQSVQTSGAGYCVAVFSCASATALVSGVDTITLTYTGTGPSQVKYAEAATINGSTAVDITANGNGSGTTETATATTVAANTVAYGVSICSAGTYTLGTGWTLVDHLNAGYDFNAIRQTYSSAGSKTTGGTYSSSGVWATAWAAYK